MQFPITIGLHRSRFLDIFVLLGAISASLVATLFPHSIALWSGLLLMIWLYSALAWHRLSPQCSAIRLERGGLISVTQPGDDEFLPVELQPGAIVHPWLTVIRWKQDNGKTGTLTATVDSMNREDFRRLRVYLRWQADFSATNGAA